MSKAENSLRAAFIRLRDGTPAVVPLGTPITQNNVAREAGKDPTAFKKSRYPGLISEIQAYVAAVGSTPRTSKRQDTLRRRKKSRKLRKILDDVTKERDHALSLLVGADSRLLELYQRIADLEAQLPPSNVRSISQDSG
jgi:hypothetical protein